MTIKDNSVREAIETIASEFEEMEMLNEQLNEENQSLNNEIETLEAENMELKQQLEELQEALAQALLTSIPPDIKS